MATSKKTGKKRVTKKKVVRKKVKARPGRRKNTFLVGDLIKPISGMDEHFYQKFPRYAAYKSLENAGEIKIADFIKRVERLSGVKSRNQALGIMTKLVDKGAASVRKAS